MYPNSLPYALALIVTSALTSALAMFAFGRRSARAGVATFAGLLIAVAWYAGAAALELIAPTLEGKVVGARLKMAGLGAIGPLWFAFALRYTRRGHWLTWSNRLLISLPSVFGFALAVSNDSHQQFWKGLALDPVSPALIVTEYGIGFWEFLLAQYLFIGAAAALYVQAYGQSSNIYRQQIRLILAGSVVPLAGNLISLAGVYPVRGLDLTPYAFAVSMVFLATGLFNLGLLDMQPVAARVVFNHLSEAVLVLDDADRVVDLNPAARSLFGLGEEAIGKPMPEVVRQAEEAPASAGGSAAGEAAEADADSAAERRPAVEVRLGPDAAPRWFRVEQSPLRDVYHRPLGRVVLLRDVSHERQLQQLRSDLTHMLIHDLSNPLSAMQMALELVRFSENGEGQLVADAEARQAVEIVKRSNLRAQRLVGGLLDVSRLESGQMPLEQQPLNAAGLAAGIVRDLTPWAEESRLTLTLNLWTELPQVMADPELLDRVIRNLVGNAVKFTPPGGQIWLALQPEGDYLAFRVRDTGPGLPAAVQSRLFQKFVRGSGPQRGHGLGLAFCKLAVEAMGGRIWAESRPGEGTTFGFTVPVYRESEPSE